MLNFAYGQSIEPEMVDVDGFSISKYEITQAQWKEIMGNNPSQNTHDDNYPVDSVSWIDAHDYLKGLNEKTGKKYRLPTEEEWNLACHGGESPQTYCGGEDIEALAWYDGNSGDKSHQVGLKQPNRLGIYDMSGNLYEWTETRHEAGGRVVKGGGFRSGPGAIRKAWYNLQDYGGGNFTGFRVVLDDVQ